jgi:uncharacterized ferredoxin-like protein
MRQCRICLETKSTTEFKSNGRKYAVENRCVSCVRYATNIRKEIRKTAPPMTLRCECCGKETSNLCLDHDHSTGKFRGWLCGHCNRGIGQLGDTIDSLKRALSYLESRTL